MQYKQTLLKGISFSYLYIFVYLVTGVLTTPILLNHFKADYFALLMLIYAIITYLNNIRFGLPESLAAILAKSTDTDFNISTVKKSFIILTFILLAALVAFFISSLFISDWRFFLGDVYALNEDDVVNVFYILIVFALIKIPLDLSLSIFVGFHEVYLEKIYKILNLLANFAVVVFVLYADKSIVFFAFAAGLLDLVVSVLSFVHVAVRYGIFRKDNITQYIDSSDLLKKGGLFFQLSFIQTIIWGAGILIVSHMLTLQDVTVYSLTMKIYIYLFYAFIIINTVIAPLYGKYFSNSSWGDIRRVFNLMILFLPFLGGFIWVGSLYFMSDVVALWTGSNEFYIGAMFVLFMGGFFYFTGYINSYVTLLYSIGEIKSIILVRWKEVILNLLVSIVATYFMGVTGIAVGMVLSISLISAWSLPKYIEEKSKGELILDFTIQKKHFLLVLLPNIIIAFIVVNSVEDLLTKVLFFLVITMVYISSSWYMLPLGNKAYITNFLKDK